MKIHDRRRLLGMLSGQEAAVRLGISPTYFDKLVADGEIPHHPPARSFRPSDLDAYVASRTAGHGPECRMSDWPCGPSPDCSCVACHCGPDSDPSGPLQACSRCHRPRLVDVLERIEARRLVRSARATIGPAS